MDKKKLESLLDIIGDLLKIEGNEWLVDGLLQKISDKAPLEEIAKHSLIKNIHEYCIEEIIDKQAHDFYHDFKVPRIQSQLIDDYKKMEHERRRDDFENFCLRVYQQLECITNHLFEYYILKKWDEEKEKNAIKSEYNEDSEKYEYPLHGGKSIEMIVFEQQIDRKWHANRKFRAVLFYFYSKKELIRNDYDFKTLYYIQDEIYQIRNKNHRGGEPTGYQQKVLDRIEGNESKYYFKFYGFLQDFVVQVNNNIHKKGNVLSKRKSEHPKTNKRFKKHKRSINHSQKDTMADLPGLKEISKKLSDDKKIE